MIEQYFHSKNLNPNSNEVWNLKKSFYGDFYWMNQSNSQSSKTYPFLKEMDAIIKIFDKENKDFIDMKQNSSQFKLQILEEDVDQLVEKFYKVGPTIFKYVIFDNKQLDSNNNQPSDNEDDQSQYSMSPRNIKTNKNDNEKKILKLQIAFNKWNERLNNILIKSDILDNDFKQILKSKQKYDEIQLNQDEDDVSERTTKIKHHGIKLEKLNSSRQNSIDINLNLNIKIQEDVPQKLKIDSKKKLTFFKKVENIKREQPKNQILLNILTKGPKVEVKRLEAKKDTKIFRF